MKIQRFKTIILPVSAAVFGITGCKSDFLDTSPAYSFSGSNVWQSPILARAAVNGIYNALYTRFTQNCDSPTVGVPSDACPQVMDIDANWKGNCVISPGNATPSNGNVATHYTYCDTSVYRANDVINHIDNVPEMDADEIARLKSEARFLRARAYCNLNVLFRGVPVCTENVEQQDAAKARSSEDEVWNQVITDLSGAIPNLPDKVIGGGKASKGAAYAFRGIAYRWTNENATALVDFEATGAPGYAFYSPSGGAAGNDDFFQLFKPANEQCAGMIFAVECMERSGMGNPRGINYGNRITGSSARNNCLPNPAFVERYENADGSIFDRDHLAVEPVNRASAPAKKTMGGRENLFMAGKFPQAGQRLRI